MVPSATLFSNVIIHCSVAGFGAIKKVSEFSGSLMPTDVQATPSVTAKEEVVNVESARETGAKAVGVAEGTVAFQSAYSIVKPDSLQPLFPRLSVFTM